MRTMTRWQLAGHSHFHKNISEELIGNTIWDIGALSSERDINQKAKIQMTKVIPTYGYHED